MNYLKKKLKPLAANLTSTTAGSTSATSKHSAKDLEDDLYDEYIVEAPPHPSELLALGVDPSQIDINDPDKLRELYRKAKQEGKDKVTNSVLLAKQRQKEEIEAKKKTHEEWKFFDSITARVEQAVKDSQKSLEQLKVSSAVNKIAEPDYELRLSADQVFRSSASVKQEHNADNWVNFNEGEEGKSAEQGEKDQPDSTEKLVQDQQDLAAQQFVVEELLEDFGIDLRPKEQRQIALNNAKQQKLTNKESSEPAESIDIDLKVAARPRPNSSNKGPDSDNLTARSGQPSVDPFDTSFIDETVDIATVAGASSSLEQNDSTTQEDFSSKVIDPFDTSYVHL